LINSLQNWVNAILVTANSFCGFGFILLRNFPGKIIGLATAAFLDGFSWALLAGFLAGWIVIDYPLDKVRRRKLANLTFFALGKMANAGGEEMVMRTEKIFSQIDVYHDLRRNRTAAANKLEPTDYCLIPSSGAISQVESFFDLFGFFGGHRQAAMKQFRHAANTGADVAAVAQRFEYGWANLAPAIACLFAFSIEEKGGYIKIMPHSRDLLIHILGVSLDDSNSLIYSLMLRPIKTSPENKAELRSAYHALGADESDTDQQIELKYRRLLGECNLNKYIALNFPDISTGVTTSDLIDDDNIHKQIVPAIQEVRRARGMM